MQVNGDVFEDFDVLIKRIKNREKVSFSWGFEYRYLQELGNRILESVATKFGKCSKNLHIVRHPSVPKYIYNSNLISERLICRLTPEIVCIDGIDLPEYVPFLKGTLANLVSGQDAIDAIDNLESGVLNFSDEIEQRLHERLELDAMARIEFSKICGVPAEHIRFCWGTGGSLELVLWAASRNHNRRPRILINTPNYFYTIALAKKFGYETRTVLSYRGNQYRFPQREMMRELSTGAYDIVVLTTPNNPFGIPISKEHLHDLVAALPSNTIAIIDVTGIADEGEVTIQELTGQNKYCDKQVLVLDSISKKYEMCHVRAGVIVCTNKDTFRSLDLDQHSPFLTKYAYEKLLSSTSNVTLRKNVLKNFRRHYELLKSVEGEYFRLASPLPSNFVVGRFNGTKELSKFISNLADSYPHYDLPFPGAGKFGTGAMHISQDYILNLPRNYVRILAETSDKVSFAIRSLSTHSKES